MTGPILRSDCVFCTLDAASVAAENRLAYAVRDTTPVTPLHTLVLPRRHVASYFDLDAKEKQAIDALLEETQIDILARDPTVAGFNIGINIGEPAGQTIFHCHVHLIPRRRGDVANPRGGVRGVILGRANY
jgi:diadenosine tetraphosphate (Ap4A) HIT family hydrolase